MAKCWLSYDSYTIIPFRLNNWITCHPYYTRTNQITRLLNHTKKGSNNMYRLLMNNEPFSTYKTLKDFNRFTKKYLQLNFKNEIDQLEPDSYKLILINLRLSYATKFRLKQL